MQRVNFLCWMHGDCVIAKSHDALLNAAHPGLPWGVWKTPCLFLKQKPCRQSAVHWSKPTTRVNSWAKNTASCQNTTLLFSFGLCLKLIKYPAWGTKTSTWEPSHNFKGHGLCSTWDFMTQRQSYFSCPFLGSGSRWFWALKACGASKQNKK